MTVVISEEPSEDSRVVSGRFHGAPDAASLAAALQRRYGTESAGDAGQNGVSPASRAAVSAGASTSIERLLGHRSVRAYAPTPLPSGTLELLVGAAQSAASSSNLQLWSVVSVSDPARRRALYEVAGNQAHILECPLFLVWVADLHRPAELARERGMASAGLDYLEMFLMASIDSALAAQNAVVAAEALGLGTVYIGALRNDPLRVAQVLELPEQAYAVFGLCVGFADPEREGAVKPRLPQSVIVHSDRYDPSPLRRGDVAAYDERMSRFYTEQRMEVPRGGWSLHSALRVASVASLRGRDLLRQALSRLGFELR